jgi:hypothetical protein
MNVWVALVSVQTNGPTELCIRALSIMELFATLNINNIDSNKVMQCCVSYIVMLNDIMVSVVILSVGPHSG